MFYEKLEKEIKKRNTNLYTLAKETGIAQPTTNKWKNGGMPNTAALIKICKYLNVSADYLLDLDDTPPPPNISDREAVLLENFRLCSTETKENIMTLASSGAERSEKEKAKEKEKTETSSELKNIG